MPLPKGHGASVHARTARNAKKKEDYPYRGAFMGKVTSPAPNEEVTFETSMGRRTSSYAYPFVSTNAWIRGQPESGTTMIAIIGSDTQELQPIGYFDPAKSNAATRYQAVVDALRSNLATPIPTLLAYRSITPGDVDFGSNFAQMHMGLKDVFQARGGLSHFTMTSKKTTLETSQFEVHGPDHVLGRNLSDETRFGVVRRVTATKGTATTPALIRSLRPSSLDATKMAFAKEHTVVLGSDSITMSGKLIDHRQGNVVDDNGSLARSVSTQQELRARLQWFSNLSATKVEIDDSGNWSVSTSLDGVDGGRIDVPTGNLSVTIGQVASLRSIGDFKIDSTLGRFTATGNLGFRIFTPADGDITASVALALSSGGRVSINTPMYQGVRIGGGVAPQHPALVANPAYIGTLNAMLSAQATLTQAIGTYGGTGSAAWGAAGPLLALLDPSATVSQLCLAAAGSAGALVAASSALSLAITAHAKTLGMNPSGFQSVKLASE